MRGPPNVTIRTVRGTLFWFLARVAVLLFAATVLAVGCVQTDGDQPGSDRIVTTDAKSFRAVMTVSGTVAGSLAHAANGDEAVIEERAAASG